MARMIDFQTPRQYSPIPVVFYGERPEPLSGREILQIAKEAEYFEQGGVVRQFAPGGTIEYVPCDHRGNSLRDALVMGILAHKFSIRGCRYDLINLEPGDYYQWVEFVEVAAESRIEGRWIGRIIDESARTRCIVPGVELIRAIRFHPDGGDPHTPRVILHRATPFGGGAPDESEDWSESSGGWDPLGGGNGCDHHSICITTKPT